jgi:hypothetical protein
MTGRTEKMGPALRKFGNRYAATVISAVGVLGICTLVLAAPVTLDSDSGAVIFKTALAKNGNDGGKGGGNGGGNGGGSNGGSNNAGGIGKGPNSNAGLSNEDNDRDMIFLQSEPTITMAQFTTKITKRYPADEIETHHDPYQSISFYCELRNMKGEQITHRWLYEDQLEYEARFKVRGEQWRIWSTQLLPEDKPGEWKVEVVDSDGKVLATQTLKFQPPGPAIAAN